MTVPEQNALPSVSVIVPTYQEAENLPVLLERIEAHREQHALDLEVLLMDDDSGDGTAQVIAELAKPWVTLVTRTNDRGLSQAVVDGFHRATKEVLLVMDADLSHPPETILDMLTALRDGAEFVLGSRYVDGGTTEEGWGFFRWLNSRVATLLALPFTRAKDPMSGFFAFRRAAFDTAAPLNPVGYKIGLEVIVKCHFRHVTEIPIHFANRHKGESKLSLREQLRYLKHLRRLALFKYTEFSHMLHFGLVGVSGTLINIVAMSILWWAGMPVEWAILLGILTAMLSNFVLNRRYTFPHAREGSWPRQLFWFIAASSLGAAVNYLTALGVLQLAPTLDAFPQIASLAGILTGLLFNYTLSRYYVFPK